MSRKGCPNKSSKKVEFECLGCLKRWLGYPSRIGKTKYCSQSCSALSRVEALRQRSMGNNWGSLRRMTPELRAKLSTSHKGKARPKGALSKIGRRNPNWRGGTSPINKRIRRSVRFFRWRKAVFERDNYTCQECNVRGGELHPDHIKPFALFPGLRFEISNGRTLCKQCHMKTPTWGFRNYRLVEQK